MQVHDERGVAPATLAEIAARAGVSQATLFEAFPELIPLSFRRAAVMSGRRCARRNPIRPARCSQACTGSRTACGTWSRNSMPSTHGARIASTSPGATGRWCRNLDGFLSAVEAGIEALVAEALAPACTSKTAAASRGGAHCLPGLAESATAGVQRRRAPRGAPSDARVRAPCRITAKGQPRPRVTKQLKRKPSCTQSSGQCR